jgi:Zn-dependent protease with chaperone function
MTSLAASSLTRLYIRLGGAQFLRLQAVKASNGAEREAFLFAADKPLFLGQCTVFKTIVLHESLLDDPELLDYVLLHEMAHQKQWWVVFGIPLVLPAVFSFFALTYALISALEALISADPSLLVTSLLSLAVFALALVIPCAFSWTLELDAEFVSIRVLGLVKYASAREKLRHANTPALGGRVIGRLTHPPTEITLRVWNWRHKQER